MGIALAFKLVLFSGIVNNVVFIRINNVMLCYVSYNQFACTCFQCNVPSFPEMPLESNNMARVYDMWTQTPRVIEMAYAKAVR